MNQLKAKVANFTYFLPQKIVSNNDLSKIVDTSDEWISTRTGIKNRYISNEIETASYMATQVAENILIKSNTSAADIDGIIVSTSTPDYVFPSTACLVQKNIQAKSAFAYDLSAACSGFLYAMHNAIAYIKSGMAKKIIIIGSEVSSAITNQTDRNTCVLFGDGASGALVEIQESADDNCEHIIDTKLYTDGGLAEILHTKCGANAKGNVAEISMQGQAVFKNAVSKMSDMIVEAMDRNNLTIDDIDWIVPHQANKRIFDAIAKNFNIDKDKIVNYIEDHGNTSSASIGIAVAKHQEKGLIKKGNKVLLESIGGGMTWGFSLVQF